MPPRPKALKKRFLQFKTDQSLYVTGNEQSLLDVQQFKQNKTKNNNKNKPTKQKQTKTKQKKKKQKKKAKGLEVAERTNVYLYRKCSQNKILKNFKKQTNKQPAPFSSSYYIKILLKFKSAQ